MTFSTFVKSKYGNVYEASKQSGVPLMYVRRFLQGDVTKKLISFFAVFFSLTEAELYDMVNGVDMDKPQGTQMYMVFVYNEPFVKG